MCQCQRQFEPNPTLQKMLPMLKIAGFINVAICLLHIFPMNAGGIMDIFNCILIFVTYNTLSYNFAQMYILFTCIDTVFMIDDIGVFFQEVYNQEHLASDSLSFIDYWSLGVNTFSLVFYIWAIYIVFEAYKEMRAQLLEIAGVNVQNMGVPQQQDQENQNQNPPPQNQWGNANMQANAPANVEQPREQRQGGGRGYVPFGGRGVRVGGN